MDLSKMIPNTHQKAVESKTPAPPAVVAIKAGLHPMSKTAQALIGNNKKK